MKRLILIFALMNASLLAQGRDPEVRGDNFIALQPSLAAADSTFSFAPDSTGNDTSAVYLTWPKMRLRVLTSSSGTPAFNVLFQTACLSTGEKAKTSLKKWLTEKTVAVSATGLLNVDVTASAITTGDRCFWRVIFDGQATNPSGTTATAEFIGWNENRN